jgi:hypothetical protein
MDFTYCKTTPEQKIWIRSSLFHKSSNWPRPSKKYTRLLQWSICLKSHALVASTQCVPHRVLMPTGKQIFFSCELTLKFMTEEEVSFAYPSAARRNQDNTLLALNRPSAFVRPRSSYSSAFEGYVKSFPSECSDNSRLSSGFSSP